MDGGLMLPRPGRTFQGWFYPSTRQHCVLSGTYKNFTRQITRQEASGDPSEFQFARCTPEPAIGCRLGRKMEPPHVGCYEVHGEESLRHSSESKWWISAAVASQPIAATSFRATE